MKRLTKKMNVLIILLIVMISTQGCNGIYANPNNVNPSTDYATINAAISAAHYVKFYATPSRNAQTQACIDGNGDGLADLKTGYGYDYVVGMQDFWFSKPGYIASAVLCDEDGNTMRVGNSDAVVNVKFGPKKSGEPDIQGYSTGNPVIYQFAVSTVTLWVYSVNIDPRNMGRYYADNSNATHLYLVNK